jgi:predicted TIM-barrel fold metal-dependent hydrolase
MPSAPVVDVDVHLSETPGDLAPYCDLPWRKVLTEPGGLPPWSVKSALHPYLGSRREPERPAQSPDELSERLAERGVDLAVLLPGALVKLGVLPTAAYATALGRAYHRWLVDRWLGRVDRGYGALLAVPQDPEDAARQIDEYAGHERIRAVVLPVAGVDPLWGARRYDPIYAAAEAAGLPVILHGGSELMLPTVPHAITQLGSQFEQLVLSHPMLAMANLLHMVGTGVLARFPNLRVVFLEAGISWLPHLMLRMDKEYNENRRDVPFYTDRVSMWVKRQVWVGTQPMEFGADSRVLDDLIRISFGMEHVLYASHWPNADHDAPDRVAAGIVGEEARRKVLGENAVELFGLRAVPAASV